VFPEQAFDLARGDSGTAGDLGDIERLVQRGLHETDRLDEFGVIDAVAGVQLQPLMILPFADLRVNELFGDAEGEFRSGNLSYKVQHHVQRGRAAGACEDITIDNVEFLRDLQLRIFRA
jgi:hypothetical protein